MVLEWEAPAAAAYWQLMIRTGEFTSDWFSCQNKTKLTIVEEVNVVRKRLVLWREVRSVVLQGLPFHSVFVPLFLPPDRKQRDENRRRRGTAGRTGRRFLPSPAVLLLLFLLLRLQHFGFFDLLLWPLGFFGDWLLSFLFLDRLAETNV